MALTGRRVIKCDPQEITADNIGDILLSAMATHEKNRAEIEYLYKYYKGDHPILRREKAVRPEINNHVVENRANEIVSFKTGYLMGEPIQFVSRTGGELLDEITTLNEYVFAEEKLSKDKELADWFHICGTSYRMVLPDDRADEEDESPFEIFTLDPRNTFVVYTNDYKEEPLLGVTYYLTEKGEKRFFCYTDTTYFEVTQPGLVGAQVTKAEPNPIGEIPIIEYPLNMARLGAFEIVLPLLDAIDKSDSDRLNAVEQFVQAIMVFYNADISSEDFDKLRVQGVLKVFDADPQMKANVEYIVNTLNQTETQTMSNHFYDAVLTICGMPNRNGNSTGGDTGTAVIYRDGWTSAEAFAKGSETMFKKSERKFLRVVLNICQKLRRMSLKVSDIEIRFTRRNYENILQKAQVLDLLLKNPDVAKKLAFEHCGLFVDPDLAYAISMEEKEENALNGVESETGTAGSGESGTEDGENTANSQTVVANSGYIAEGQPM